MKKAEVFTMKITTMHACIVCSWLWQTQHEKKSEKRLICEICDNYVCPESSCIGLDENDGFY